MLMKKQLYVVLLSAGLAGCSDPSDSGLAAQNAETEKRIAVCQEVMKTYIQQANTYERDRKRLIGSCQISQKERTLEQWQCALSAMQNGEKYESASDKCGRTSTAQP